jgi:lipoprotein-anchoring transpeptidase ErfK/SrfK
MTLLPLARTLLSAFVPLLSANDSTTVTRPTPAPTPAAIAVATPMRPAPKVAADTSAVATGSQPPLTSAITTLTDALDPAAASATAAAATASSAAPAASAAPKLAAGGWTYAPGMVPMPDWAVGAHLGLAHAGHADSIVVEKSQHRMTLFSGHEVLGTYLVALGQRSTGAKERAGDFKTPEGLYHIDAKNSNSHYHLALHVSYPNAADLARAHTLGVSTGGDIMIHGLPNGQGSAGITHRNYDWTNGCIAVTDQEIEEIFGAVPVGTPVRIMP